MPCPTPTHLLLPLQLKSVNQYNKQFTAAMRDSVTALHAGRQAARQWAQDQLEVVAPGANPTGNVDYSVSPPAMVPHHYLKDY